MKVAIGRFFKTCEPERAKLVEGLVLIALEALLRIVAPLVAAWLISKMIAGQLVMAHIKSAAVICFVVLITRFLIARTAHKNLWTLSYKITGRVRREVLEQLKRVDVQTADTADFVAVISKDAGRIAGFISWELPYLIVGVVLPVAVLVTMLFYSPVIAIPAFFVVISVAPVLRRVVAETKVVVDSRRELYSESTHRMLEYVVGIDVIRSHGLAGEKQQTFRDALYSIRDIDIHGVSQMTPLYARFQTLIDCGYALSLLAGAFQLWLSPDSADSVVVALLLTTVLYRPQKGFAARCLHLPDIANGLARLEAWSQLPVRNEPRTRLNAPGSAAGGAGVGAGAAGGGAGVGAVSVELAGISARYGQGPLVLDGFDLSVEPGSVTAIVGPSGSGKSTVLKVIAGLVTPVEGELSFSGVPLPWSVGVQAAMSQQDGTDMISAVFQDVGIASGSIATIISSKPDGGERSRVIAAARAARIDSRIELFDEGYDKVLGEGGRGLSGGELQRLAIARAIYKDAPVVLLDEATSALDATSELQVREALRQLSSDKTTIVVAHRLETIRQADQIVFLDGGKIVEQGSHDELVAADGRYAHFWRVRKQGAGWRLES